MRIYTCLTEGRKGDWAQMRLTRSPTWSQANSLALQGPPTWAGLLHCCEIGHIFVQLESTNQHRVPKSSVTWSSCDWFSQQWPNTPTRSGSLLSYQGKVYASKDLVSWVCIYFMYVNSLKLPLWSTVITTTYIKHEHSSLHFKNHVHAYYPI